MIIQKTGKQKRHEPLTYAGKTLSIANWAKIRRMTKQKIYERLRRGWTVGEALEFDVREFHTNNGNGRPRLIRRRTEPPEELRAITKVVEIIDNEAVRRTAKKIRQSCGVTQKEAAAEIKIRCYELLENGKRKWTQPLIDRFNAVAKTWVVETSKAD
jgi:hypothetical protein